MNDSDLRIDSEKKNTYHATTNLNTAIENPQINMNSAMGVNIQDIDNNFNNNYVNNQIDVNNSYNIEQNYFDSNVNISDNSQNFYTTSERENSGQGDVGNSNFQSQFVPTSSNSTTYDDEVNLTSSTQVNNQVAYEPVLQEKKKPSSGFEISREFKVMMFIVFILFLFILVVPYIYDFFRGLQLAVTTG